MPSGNEATVKIDIISENNVSATVTQISNDLGNLNDRAAQVSNTLDHVDDDLQDVSDSADRAGSDIDGLAGAADGMVAAFGAFLSIDAAAGIISLGEDMSALTARLQIAVGGQDDYNDVLEQTYVISQLTSTALDENLKTITSLASGVQLHGGTLRQAIELQNVFAKSLKVSRESLEEQEDATDNLREAITLGLFEGSNIEPMLLRNAAFAKALAEALDTDTVGLLAMAEAYELTVSKVLGALPRVAEIIERDFDGVALSIDDAFQRVSNSFSKAVLDASNVSGASNQIAVEINNIAVIIEQHEDVIGGVFETVATGAGYAVRAIAGIDGIFRGAAAAAVHFASIALDGIREVVIIADSLGVIDDGAAKIAELDVLINAADESSLDLANQARESFALVFSSVKEAKEETDKYNEKLKETVAQEKAVEQAAQKTVLQVRSHADAVQLLSSGDTGIEQYRKEIQLIDGAWQNVSQSAYDAGQSGVISLGSMVDASGKLPTTWRKIGDLWTEVLMDGRTLAEAMKSEIIDGADAAKKLGGNVASAAVQTSEAKQIISGLVDGYDAAAGASGELAKNLDALAEKKRELSIVEGEIAKLEIHLERSRDNAEQTKEIMEQMAVAEAAQRKLTAEIGNLETAIDDTGKAAEETKEKISDIAKTTDAVATATAAATEQTREYVAANKELAAAVEDVTAAASKPVSFGQSRQNDEVYSFGGVDLSQVSDEELNQMIESERQVVEALTSYNNLLAKDSVQMTVDFSSTMTSLAAKEEREESLTSLLSDLKTERLRRNVNNLIYLGDDDSREQLSGSGVPSAAPAGFNEEIRSLGTKLDTIAGYLQRPQTINLTVAANIDEVEEELQRRGYSGFRAL